MKFSLNLQLRSAHEKTQPTRFDYPTDTGLDHIPGSNTELSLFGGLMFLPSTMFYDTHLKFVISGRH